MKGAMAMKRMLALLLTLLIAATPAAQAENTDELLIQVIEACFSMTREEIIEAFGPNFEEVAAGPEGVCDGYYYEEVGITFAFYPDTDELDSISCDESFRIYGVGVGSYLTEIIETLDDVEIIETWVETPYNKAFMVPFSYGNIHFNFIAFDKDTPVDLLWIYQLP